jgi:hypothetical protein
LSDSGDMHFGGWMKRNLRAFAALIAAGTVATGCSSATPQAVTSVVTSVLPSVSPGPTVTVTTTEISTVAETLTTTETSGSSTSSVVSDLPNAGISTKVSTAQLRAASEPDADPGLVRDICYSLFGYAETLQSMYGISDGAKFVPLDPAAAKGIRCFYGTSSSGNSAAIMVWLDPADEPASPFGPDSLSPQFDSGTWSGDLASIDLLTASGMVDTPLADEWMSHALSHITIG